MRGSGRAGSDRRRARHVVAAGLVIGTLSVGGCSGHGTEPPAWPPLYAKDIEDARAKASNEFERRVLADGALSRAEYKEAVRRYVQCVVDLGFQTSAELDATSGFYQYKTVTQDDPDTVQVEGPDADPALISCAPGTTGLVEPLYVAMVRNPTKIDEDELELQCLKRKNVVPTSFSVTQYREARNTTFAGSPIDPDSKAMSDCMANPSAP